MMGQQLTVDQDDFEQAFDGAKYSTVDAELRVVAVWKGGFTVNIYSTATLGNLEAITVGDQSNDEPTRDRVKSDIDDWFAHARKRMTEDKR